MKIAIAFIYYYMLSLENAAYTEFEVGEDN